MMETTKDKICINIQYSRKSLAQRCKVLSDNMLRLAKKLESDQPHTSLYVNDLGEIQSEGTTIDALCGRLMGKISVWKQM